MRIVTEHGPVRSMLWIFAGSEDEARFLAEKAGLAREQWQYLWTAKHLRGQRGTTVWMVGTWMLRSDCSEVELAMAYQGCRAVHQVRVEAAA